MCFPKAVFDLALFDLDGTLVDSLPDIAAALNATLAEAGFPPVPAAQVSSYVGDGAAKLVERALPREVRASGDLDQMVHHFRGYYARHLHDQTRPYPGIEEVLQRLSSAMPLAVVTNKPSELARPLLAGLGLDRYFSDVIGDGDGFARKPAPEAGLWLLARHGVTTPRTLVIGDGIPDLRFARALGSPAAAVTWGYVARELLQAEAPAWLADTPEQLLSIVAGLAGGPVDAVPGRLPNA
jgi:phosphoglycolate phosphatase